jgi:diadenosine tetraphosphatase ApaH/serine/threonine PP2A family protein phosphatase
MSGAAPPVLRANYHVFQNCDSASQCGAYGKEQIDHANNRRPIAEHQYLAALWKVDNLPQTGRLQPAIGPEFSLLREQEVQDFTQLRDIIICRAGDFHDPYSPWPNAPGVRFSGDPVVKEAVPIFHSPHRPVPVRLLKFIHSLLTFGHAIALER